ncbi:MULTISPECIES: hypothetical protein [Streptomycetaceae]|uniref:Secreted protein n=1 Tax=Streptantibioticus cattleyicolor (strain ATCC 35852 / DSM 46488 / JCM 4925 / NBRC 14057 / NRRL 8057) TaxID=1003195 RepID=F8JXR6_STREN|nr:MULTISPECIES: hypothetical protein [Streptomycetaceae]AEW97172.1 hypothetical protein SCATT_48010 [Streptantibioticus cattleyicolor NRRL 8057 = DSM 46488]MYS61629.1 hypothetical protein [Streptomyces sp. SID5468]CCB77495.1 exported protein of unknown function [Streptantibioticus cattleyicolor NRRL 8057 = DSM 46488]
MQGKKILIAVAATAAAVTAGTPAATAAPAPAPTAHSGARAPSPDSPTRHALGDPGPGYHKCGYPCVLCDPGCHYGKDPAPANQRASDPAAAPQNTKVPYGLVGAAWNLVDSLLSVPVRH